MSNTDQEENNFGPFEDLESQQYKKLYTGYDVLLIDIRKKYFKSFLISGIAILAVIVLLSVSLSIPNYLKIPIEVENVDKDMVKMFNHSVKVDNFFVESGDTLSENQRICKISSPEIQELVSEIQSAQSKLMVLESIDSLDINLKINNLDNEITNKKNLLAALNREKIAVNQWYLSKREALNSEVTYFKELEEVNKNLLESGFVSKLSYLEVKKNYINKREELNSHIKEFDQKLQQLDFKTKEINGEAIALTNTQNETFSTYQNDQSKFKEQIQLALNKLKLFYGNFKIEDDGLYLLAPRKSLLSFGYPSNKLLKSGEILYRLESSKGNFEVKGFVNADKIGYLKQDLKAKILLNTFPNYEWGNLTGIVNYISRSPNEVGLYALNIKITERNPKISPLLQNGQTGNSFILIEEKTLFGYLRRKVNKSIDDILN